MKTLRITTAALAIALGMGISSTSQAFMASPVEAQAVNAETQLTTTLEALREEIVVGEYEIDEMVAKLNAFVKHIDQMLEEGVESEDLYLAAREEAISLRQSLPGIDKYLTQAEGQGGTVIDSFQVGGQSMNQGFSSGGGFSGGGGGGFGGGGILGGGNGLGLLGTIGLAVGIPLGIDSDDPGPVASESLLNN